MYHPRILCPYLCPLERARGELEFGLGLTSVSYLFATSLDRFGRTLGKSLIRHTRRYPDIWIGPLIPGGSPDIYPGFSPGASSPLLGCSTVVSPWTTLNTGPSHFTHGRTRRIRESWMSIACYCFSSGELPKDTPATTAYSNYRNLNQEKQQGALLANTAPIYTRRTKRHPKISREISRQARHGREEKNDSGANNYADTGLHSLIMATRIWTTRRGRLNELEKKQGNHIVDSWPRKQSGKNWEKQGRENSKNNKSHQEY